MNGLYDDAVASERAVQREQGRLIATREKVGLPKQVGTKKKIAPKGHEAFLKALEASVAQVEFFLVSEPTSIVGYIKTSDKYTISIVEAGEQCPIVVFKHDISRFKPLQSRPVEVM